jgi:hypothetical protein
MASVPSTDPTTLLNPFSSAQPKDKSISMAKTFSINDNNIRKDSIDDSSDSSFDSQQIEPLLFKS